MVKYPIGLLEEELKNKVVRTLCVLRDLRVRFNSPRRRVPFVTRGASSGGTTPNTSILHDAFGNITNATDTAGNSWQFTYSANSTLTNEVFTSPRLRDSVCQTNALARIVDSCSRPVGYDLTLGDTPCSRVHYGYDAEGRIATLAATNAANRGFQVEYHNESGYNCGYMLMTPNGAILTRTVTRDPFRRSLTLDCTTRFNNVEVASFAYTFDAHNRPIARNNDRFAYNDRDEITSALIGTNIINRAYDTIGNHVFCAFNSATNFYANNQLNQTVAQYSIVSHGGTEPRSGEDAGENESLLFTTNSLTWSAQGGLQRDGRFVYAFDAEDQLTSVTSSHLTNGAIRVVNAYDYRHRRISKTVYTMRDDSPPASPLAPPLPIERRTWCLQERHDFVYDDWNLIHETVTTVDANSTTNVTEIEYFWGPDLSDTLQGAGGVGGLLAVSMNGAFYFPVYDNLGNIVKYLDENGNVVASYTYDDFGRIIEKIGTMADDFHHRFSTKYFDSEIGLLYYGFRFYSTLWWRWLSRDPYETNPSDNLYSFVDNNGLSFVDVSGLSKVEAASEFEWVIKKTEIRRNLGRYGTDWTNYKREEYSCFSDRRWKERVEANKATIGHYTEEVVLEVRCSCKSGKWFATSAIGIYTPIIEKRTTVFTEEIEKKIVLAESQHKWDMLKWLKGEGTTIVRDFLNDQKRISESTELVAKDKKRRFKTSTKERCEYWGNSDLHDKFDPKIQDAMGLSTAKWDTSGKHNIFIDEKKDIVKW